MKHKGKHLASVLAALVLALAATQIASAARESTDKVFWMTISEVPISKLAEYHTLAAETIMPLFEDHGCSWVASWQTVVGDVEEIVAVAEFENIDAYHSARVSLLNSPEWEHLSSTLRPLLRNSKSRILSATEYSPLQ